MQSVIKRKGPDTTAPLNVSTLTSHLHHLERRWLGLISARTRTPVWEGAGLVAIEKPARADVPHGVVWMLCPENDDCVGEDLASPNLVSRVQVWEPPHVTRRISAQAAAFTVHPLVGGVFVAVEDDAILTSRLQKIIVPSGRFEDVRDHLDRCGIHAASIYADLDGLARHIEWSNSYFEDETSWDSHELIAGKDR